MARIILRDGKVAEFREANDDEQDRRSLRDLFRRVSPESLYFRFFHAIREVSEEFIDSLVGANSEVYTLLCVAGDTLLGVGTYTRQQESAEVAFMVDDRLHGKGIGTLLLEHLAEKAWKVGITQFEAFILEENYKMITVFTTSGYDVISKHDSGMIRLALPLVKTERIRALSEAREKLASVASLAPFFRPHTVAVVGASRDPLRFGHVLFRHILEGEFEGVVYPINPTAKSVAGVRAYARLTDVPEAIDLAVLVVPALQTMQVVEDCIHAGVRAVMITSSGFSERSVEGGILEREIVQQLRSAGCRVLGPNGLGLVNATQEVRLNASFVSRFPLQGKLSIASQSGALGIAILEYATRLGVGIAHFVSMGNKADVSGNDLLQYWEDDTDTDMIVLYLESFGNPRKFSRIARRITRVKPILAVKGGRTSAALSMIHAEGQSVATEDAFVEALFSQAGIIRLDTLPELLDVAAFLAYQPLPKGRRVAILTNTAGGAVMAVDALLQHGLELVHAPIDLGFEELAQGYRDVLPQLLRDPAVDAILVIFAAIGKSDTTDVIRAVAEAVREADLMEKAKNRDEHKPILANFLITGEDSARFFDAFTRKIPMYPFPEQACRTLSKVIGYAEYLSRARGHEPDLASMRGDEARMRVRQAKVRADGSLTEPDVTNVLQAAGLDGLADLVMNFTIMIVMDRSFGMMLGMSHGHVKQIREAQIIRLLPLTDLDVQDILLNFTKQGFLTKQDQPHLAYVLFTLSRLIDEVPDIVFVMMNPKGECQIKREVVH